MDLDPAVVKPALERMRGLFVAERDAKRSADRKKRWWKYLVGEPPRLSWRFDELPVPGMLGHQFELRSPLTAAEVERAEAFFGARFPDDYRTFLLEVGNGPAGPSWGLFPLVEGPDGWSWGRGRGRPVVRRRRTVSPNGGVELRRRALRRRRGRGEPALRRRGLGGRGHQGRDPDLPRGMCAAHVARRQRAVPRADVERRSRGRRRPLADAARGRRSAHLRELVHGLAHDGERGNGGGGPV